MWTAIGIMVAVIVAVFGVTYIVTEVDRRYF